MCSALSLRAARREKAPGPGSFQHSPFRLGIDRQHDVLDIVYPPPVMDNLILLDSQIVESRQW